MAIQNVSIADNGHLMIVLDDGTVRDAGNVRGIPGPQGERGIQGTPGVTGAPGPAGSGISNTTVQNTITVGATVTAPAVGTRTVQRLESQTVGDKLRLTYRLGQVAAAPGSGDYLLSLPAGVSFNTAYNPVFAGALWTGGVNNMAQYFIPATGGMVIDANWTNQIAVVPYDATRFRIAMTNNISQNVYQVWSSAWYAANAASGWNLQLQFEIWK